VLITRALVKSEPWSKARQALRWTAHLTWITVVLFVLSFIVMVATFAHALGGLPSAPPLEVPADVVALVGWTDRLLVISAWAWIATVAWLAIRFRSQTTTAPVSSAVVGAKG
jgi:hypothetical protein